MRELTYPSLTYMLASAYHATSVGPSYSPSTARFSAGADRLNSKPSYPSGRRPRFMRTYPAGLNFMIEFVPLSTIHRLSYLSKRTECEYPRPYTPLPISRRNLPLESNSQTCVVALPYSGPDVAVPG